MNVKCEGKVKATQGYRSAHKRRRLVLATSPCNKSRGQVPSCKLAIFASKSSRRDQRWSLRVVPRIQTSLNFCDKSPRLVPQKASCELFWDKSLQPVPLCKLFRGLVTGTSPLLCADLKAFGNGWTGFNRKRNGKP